MHKSKIVWFAILAALVGSFFTLQFVQRYESWAIFYGWPQQMYLRDIVGKGWPLQLGAPKFFLVGILMNPFWLVVYASPFLALWFFRRDKLTRVSIADTAMFTVGVAFLLTLTQPSLYVLYPEFSTLTIFDVLQFPFRSYLDEMNSHWSIYPYYVLIGISLTSLLILAKDGVAFLWNKRPGDFFRAHELSE